MKKQISILAAAIALLMGVSSCSKDNGSADATGDGTLKISFNFATSLAPKSATSDAVPVTAWANVTDLKLVLVQSGVAKVVRDVTIPVDGTDVTPSQIFDRIPAGNYDIYLIGNNSKVGNPFECATAKIGTAATIQAGTNFNSALFNMVAAQSTAVLGTPATGAAYDEASELFIGYASGTVVAETVTATINVDLKRAVSLLRVRINQTDVTSEANTIDFTNATNANTGIRLRRHATSLKLITPAVAPYSAAQFAADRVNFAFVSTKTFQNAEPATEDYTGSMGINVADFTLWNDYVILPGGNATVGAEKFNLLLSGHAPDGYQGINGAVSNGTGETARVWWQADVDDFIIANGILSLNVKVATKGYVDPNPPTIETYGKLNITATLVDWSPVKNVTVPM